MAQDGWALLEQEDEHGTPISHYGVRTRSAVVKREVASGLHTESVEVYRVDYWTWAKHAAFASFILTCFVGGGLLLSLERIRVWQPLGHQLVTEIMPWLMSVVLLCPVMFLTSMAAVWGFNLIASRSRGLRVAVITWRKLSVGPYDISGVGILPATVVGGAVGGLLAAVTFAMVAMMAQVPSGFLSPFREGFRANMEVWGMALLSTALGGALLGLLMATLHNAAAKLFGGILVRMAAVDAISVRTALNNPRNVGMRSPDLQIEPLSSVGGSLPPGQIEIESIDSLLTGWLLALHNGLVTLGLALVLAVVMQMVTEAQVSLPLNVAAVAVGWNMLSGLLSGILLSLVYNLAATEVGGCRLRISPLS